MPSIAFRLYTATNIVTGERYIGVTKKSIWKRRAHHFYVAKDGDGPFSVAIRSHGRAAFMWEVISEFPDLASARLAERQMIDEIKPAYNLIRGGGGRSYYLRNEMMPKGLGTANTQEPRKPRWNGPEEWRPVAEYEGYYEVSNFGDVRSLDREVYRGRAGYIILPGRTLKKRIDRVSGRLRVSLCVNDVRKDFKIATLVAEAFIGPRPHGLEVCHDSDDKSDNSLGNLHYGTHLENCADRIANGKQIKGGAASWSILTESEVRAIKEELQNGTFQRELATRYDVTREAISRIAIGKNWSHVSIRGGG